MNPTTVEIADESGVTRDKPLHFFRERYAEARRSLGFVEEMHPDLTPANEASEDAARSAADLFWLRRANGEYHPVPRETAELLRMGGFDLYETPPERQRPVPRLRAWHAD